MALSSSSYCYTHYLPPDLSQGPCMHYPFPFPPGHTYLYIGALDRKDAGHKDAKDTVLHRKARKEHMSL
eukprot:1158723-Pelagomonas_calceolata.AAC.6